MIPRIDQCDAAWVWLDVDADPPVYVLECWLCGLTSTFDPEVDNVSVVYGADDLPFRYAPKYLVDTVNFHNAFHNALHHNGVEAQL